MYKVYGTHQDGAVNAYMYGDNCITDALAKSNELRNSGYSFVIIAVENPNQVGKMGVDSIINGKLPSGEEYTWKKRRI
jgi:hypothetical protein